MMPLRNNSSHCTWPYKVREISLLSAEYKSKGTTTAAALFDVFWLIFVLLRTDVYKENPRIPCTQLSYSYVNQSQSLSSQPFRTKDTHTWRCIQQTKVDWPFLVRPVDDTFRRSVIKKCVASRDEQQQQQQSSCRAIASK